MASSRPKLDRATIVAQSIALLNEEGFEALSLRRLATRLGVQAPAIYWYFADRAALLEAMVEELMERVPVPHIPMRRADTADWVCNRGSAFRQMLLGIRDSVRLMAEATVNPRMYSQFQEMLREVEGLDASQVTHLAAVMYSYVLGWVHYQQQPRMHRFLEEHLDIDTAFETGLRAIARGMVEQLGLED